MKSTLTILFSFLSLFIFGQPSGNIEEDTAKANQLFEEAISLDDNERAIELLEKAALLYKAHPFQEKQIEIYGYLAYNYLNLKDSLGEVYAMKAVDLADSNFKENYPYDKLIYSYYTLFRVSNLYDIEKSLGYGNKILEYVKKPSDLYFQTCELQASLYTYSDNLTALENLIDETEHFIKSDTTWSLYHSPLLRAKMQLYYKKNNYEKSILYGQQSIAKNSKNQYFSDDYIGTIYTEIGLNQSFLGFHERGIQSLEKGIEISQATGYALATYYANIAVIYSKMGELQQAIDKDIQVLDILYEDSISNKGAIAIIHNNISVFYYKMADYENSLYHIKKASELKYSLYNKQHYANVLNALDKKDEALRIFQELIVELSSSFNSNNIHENPSKFETFKNDDLILYVLVAKSRILIKRGIKGNLSKDVKTGIETAELAKFVWTKSIEFSRGNQKSQLSNLKIPQAILDDILYGTYYLKENAIENEERLYNVIEERKSLFLLKSLTLKDLPDSLTLREQELVNLTRYYKQKSITNSDSASYYQMKLFEIDNELEVFLDKIRTMYPKETSNYYHLKYTTINTIQKDLDERDLVIEYAYIERDKNPYLYITVISKTDVNTYKIITNKFFNDNIDELNRLLQNPFLVQNTNREKFINLSHELYQILIEPIAKELGDKKKLIIIPEGKLFELPFEVLLASNEKKPFHELDFLIKDFEISYQYSATIYHQLKQKAAIKDNSFLGFAPVFENGQTIDVASRAATFIVDSLYRSIDNEQFISLPNTEKEINEIEKIVQSKNGQTTTLLKSSATKSNLTNKIKSKPYQFVHIATHGIVNFQDPKLSALVCYDNTNDVEKALYFANEIQMQDIQADLVVLSSCESGIGQLVAGEGLIALNRSFIYSGANNVMFSLWKVNDEYTSKLMIDFYKFYYQNPSYTTALRQAKLKMLQNPIAANPRFWAAFVLIGE